MHSKEHAHSGFGMRWSAADATVAILITLLFLIFVFLFMMITATPAQGQNAVPATARQAATSSHCSAHWREPQLRRRIEAQEASRLGLVQGG